MKCAPTSLKGKAAPAGLRGVDLVAPALAPSPKSKAAPAAPLEIKTKRSKQGQLKAILRLLARTEGLPEEITATIAAAKKAVYAHNLNYAERLLKAANIGITAIPKINNIHKLLAECLIVISGLQQEKRYDLLSQPRITGEKDVGHVQGPLHDYLKSRGVPESLQPKLAAKLDAVVTAEITGREPAPSLAVMTPQQTAALTADTPLGRLQIRYEKRLREIVLPEDKIEDGKQARAAGSLAATYRNLVKQQTKLGLAPQPLDGRVLKAQRLTAAFYREQKAGHAPRPRGRPSKVAMNALA